LIITSGNYAVITPITEMDSGESYIELDRRNNSKKLN